jgi:HK97 family phage portal protein
MSVFSRLFAQSNSEPAAVQRKSVPSWLEGAQASAQAFVYGTAKPVWSQRNYQRFADEAYRRNVIAHRAVSLIADAVASVPWQVNAVAPAQGNLAAQTLLSRMNPLQTRRSFIRDTVSYQLIGGNAWLLAVGPSGQAPSELHLLRPDRVQVVPGVNGLPKAYQYTVEQKTEVFPVDPVTGLSKMLHLKQFHPYDDWLGLSPVEAAAYAIDQHNQSGAWNQALMQQGARPSGALVVQQKDGGGVLSDEQFARLKQQVDAEFSGASNAGRPIILEGGLDWKEMALSPKEMDYIEGKHAAARDIALAFGVPPQLLGIPGDNTYANLAEARLALWEQTVLPHLQMMLDTLVPWVNRLCAAAVEVTPDADDIPALVPRRESLWQRVKDADFLSDEEKRAMLGIA